MTSEIEDLVICPYNKSHLITPHKLPNHLVKCRKSNPVVAENIKICPYNQCHHIPKEELEQHFRTCKDYHNFQAISIKPATRDRLPYRPLKNVDMLGQEQVRYNSHRKEFDKLPKTKDPNEAAIQHQRNLDDLDEWFVE